MAEDFAAAVNAALDDLVAQHQADLLVYAGQITRQGADNVYSAITSRKKQKNLLMVLCTIGGDPHAAFKISRYCQQFYKTRVDGYKAPSQPIFSVFVPSLCKSAGTIIAIGADRIIMSDDAELGPIDTQLRKPEEVGGELTSTLTPVQALQSIQRQIAETFISTFTKLRFDDKLAFPTKLAAEMSKDLAASIMSPISGQIDPMRLAETERALKISSEYASRLTIGNLKDEGLVRLLADYPSHGFVIDKREARSLFENVLDPDEVQIRIARLLHFLYANAADRESPYVHIVQRIEPSGPAAQPATDAAQTRQGDAAGVGPAGEGGQAVQQDTGQPAQGRRRPRRPATDAS